MSSNTEVYKFSGTWLTLAEYYNILSNYDETKLCSKPPVKPKPGEIYLYKNQSSDHAEDWKADQHRWRHKGIKNLPGSEPILTCFYYKTYHGQGFFKRVYVLYPWKKSESSVMLLHYMGSLTGVVHSKHGNRKKNVEIPHVMTAKSQLRLQKANIHTTADKVYKNLTAVEEDPAHIPVLLPRDRVQVTNTILKERNRRLLSQDDIVGLYLLSEETNNFVKKIELLPHFVTIMFSDKALEEFSQLQYDNALYYDTTFNLGDFYVSPLIYKHPYFEGGPVIPIAYMIHHRKYAEVHETFFRCIAKACSKITTEQIPIVTDREAAIAQAIKTVLPDNHHVFCWNHILQDINHWVKKQKNTEKTDITSYNSHVWNLLDSNSIEEYFATYECMAKHWSKNFKSYFDKHLFGDVEKSGKWVLEKLNLYTEHSGVTINPEESFNSVLKRCTEKKEVSAQVLALSLYQLDLFYQKEILRGYCNYGNYKLKADYQIYKREMTDVNFPKQHLPLDKLPYIFQNNDFGISDKNTSFTKYSLAKMLVLDGNVRLVPEEQVFLVSSESNNKYVVTLFPKETCTCNSKRNCHHIEAAKLSIGNENHNQKNIKLTTIMKRKRGYRTGRKSGPENITVVEAAGDSIIQKSSPNNAGTTLLIPTISSTTKVVKKRFVAPFENEEFAISTPNYSCNTPEKPRFHKGTNLCLAMQSEEFFDSDSEEQFVLKEVAKKRRQQKLNVPLSTRKMEFDDSFKQQFEKNRQFTILGRIIYPQEVLQIEPEVVKSEQDLYLSDSVLDLYFKILHYENKTRRRFVTCCCVECYIMNSYNSASAFEIGIHYFIKNLIPQNDIVILPIISSSHCRVFIFLRKYKILLHLDSLPGIVLSESLIMQVNYLKKLYCAYYQYHKLDSTVDDWTIISPQDLPKQSNGYDCGLYCCLFVEILLSMDENVIQYHNTYQMGEYRKIIKNKIFSYMTNTSIKEPAQTQAVVSKGKLKTISEPEVTTDLKNVTNCCPDGQSILHFLGNIILNYWDEDTASLCFLREECQDINGTMIICENCNHWFHLKCVGIAKLPKHYICSQCI